MAKHRCFVYPKSDQSNWDAALEKIIQESGLEQDEIKSHIEEKKFYIFENLDKDKALQLIQEFNEMNIAASLYNIPLRAQKMFNLFQDGLIFKWNWFAALFNTLWYFIKDIYAKSILIVIVFYFSNQFYWLKEFGIAEVLILLYCGIFGNYDYYLSAVRGERLWPKFPWKKFKAVFWVLIIITIGLPFWKIASQVKWNIAMMNERPVSFTLDSGTFTKIPGDWTLKGNLSWFTALKIPDREDRVYDFYAHDYIPGIQAMSFINIHNEKNENYPIALASIISKPVSTNNLQDQTILKDAFDVVNPDDLIIPIRVVMDFLHLSKRRDHFQSVAKTISYEKIGKHHWGKMELELTEGKHEPKEAIGQNCVFWTIANNKIVFIKIFIVNGYVEQAEKSMRVFLEGFQE